jgi:hypothetical protein
MIVAIYIITGASRVVEDSNRRLIDQPGYIRNPSFSSYFWMILMWPILPMWERGIGKIECFGLFLSYIIFGKYMVIPVFWICYIIGKIHIGLMYKLLLIIPILLGMAIINIVIIAPILSFGEYLRKQKEKREEQV